MYDEFLYMYRNIWKSVHRLNNDYILVVELQVIFTFLFVLFSIV